MQNSSYLLGLIQKWFRELSLSRLECGVHDKLRISSADWWDILLPLTYIPDRRDQQLSCILRKTQRYTISNVETQVFTSNITCLVRAGIEPWTTACLADGLTTTTAPLLWLINMSPMALTCCLVTMCCSDFKVPFELAPSQIFSS